MSDPIFGHITAKQVRVYSHANGVGLLEASRQVRRQALIEYTEKAQTFDELKACLVASLKEPR